MLVTPEAQCLVASEEALGGLIVLGAGGTQY